MVNAKNRKGASVQLDYLIHIQDIKPWPPSQSLRSLRSVLIQWETGDRKSGSTNTVVPSLGSIVDEGKIEFNESFRLPVTLFGEISGKGKDADSFQKNILEFNLCEPRRDKVQTLATGVIDLADYGIVREAISVSTPMSSNRSFKNTSQPILYLKIQPVDKGHTTSSLRDGVSKGISQERKGSESVSALMDEEYAEEADVASFTDDDISSHSSLTNGVLPPHGDENATGVLTQNKAGVIMQNFNASRLGIEKHIASQQNLKESSSCSSSVDLSLDVESPTYVTRLKIHKLKHMKSVRSLPDSARSNGLVSRNWEDEVKEFDALVDAEETARNNKANERKIVKTYPQDTRTTILNGRIQQLENKIKMLEGELREAAAVEAAIYSVVAEHGCSISKVHTPARRLSRLYIHACRENSRLRRAGAARNAVSGLVLVAKACGNDVPRLTFWLSNSVVLRAIIGQAIDDKEIPIFAGQNLGRNNKGKKNNMISSSSKWKKSYPSRNENMNISIGDLSDMENPYTFLSALERVEAWIFSRTVESIWWQTLTPHMQSDATKAIARLVSSGSKKSFQRKSSSGGQDQVNFSLELWKNAFKDACERLCPVRAGGHNCGCLPELAKLIMEQCVARLDVAMFNAILRESADDIPTDPVSDPISDSRVLPIPASNSSFGAGVQLKNAIGDWSRWLTDLFGMDDDLLENDNEEKENDKRRDASFKSFHLLNALSDLMMLPKDMLLNRSIRKEVCPTFGAPLIKRILENFTSDEFCPDPIPEVVFEALSSEDPLEAGQACATTIPCIAAPPLYLPPSASVAAALGQPGTRSQLRRSGSLLRKCHTSDDELDELISPLASIFSDGSRSSPAPTKLTWKSKEISDQSATRYELLRDVWMNADQPRKYK